MTVATNAGPVQGIRADHRHDRPKVYEEGRVCENEGCDTVLHRYNPNPTCDPHTEAKKFYRVERRF